MLFKGTLRNLSEPPFIEWHVRFTTFVWSIMIEKSLLSFPGNFQLWPLWTR